MSMSRKRNLTRRVALVAYDRADYRAGPIVNARRLLPSLARAGCEPVGLIFHDGTGAPNAEAIRAAGVRCVVQRRWRYTEEGVVRLIELINELEPDVFVANISVAGWFAGWWSRAAGVPTVAGHLSNDAFHAAMVQRFIVGGEPWGVSGVFFMSEYSRDAVLDSALPRTRGVVIPHGVPMPTSRAAGLGPPIRVAYLGRLQREQKRLDRVGAAMVSLLQHDPTAEARVAGTGPEERWLRASAERAGVADRLHLLGAVEPERLGEALDGVATVLLLSDYEGMPGALMDAMAHGVVPICTDFAGVRELVRDGDNGFIVDGSPASVVAAVERLRADAERFESMSRAARATVEAGYSLEEATRRWVSFCEALVADAGPKRLPIPVPSLKEVAVVLPPVLPGHRREDVRRGSWSMLLVRKAARLTRRTWRAVRG